MPLRATDNGTTRTIRIMGVRGQKKERVIEEFITDLRDLPKARQEVFDYMEIYYGKRFPGRS